MFDIWVIKFYKSTNPQNYNRTKVLSFIGQYEPGFLNCFCPRSVCVCVRACVRACVPAAEAIATSGMIWTLYAWLGLQLLYGSCSEYYFLVSVALKS